MSLLLNGLFVQSLRYAFLLARVFSLINRRHTQIAADTD